MLHAYMAHMFGLQYSFMFFHTRSATLEMQTQDRYVPWQYLDMIGTRPLILEEKMLLVKWPY